MVLKLIYTLMLVLLVPIILAMGTIAVTDQHYAETSFGERGMAAITITFLGGCAVELILLIAVFIVKIWS